MADAEITGIMSAAYETRDKSRVRHVLYDSCSRPKFGELIEISTFGVPTYSLLDIGASVTVNGDEILSCQNLVLPHGLDEIPPIETKNYRLRILVTWRHANWYLPESKIYEWCDCDPEKWDIIEEINSEKEKEKQAVELIDRCEWRLKGMRENKFRPFRIPASLQALNNRQWCVSSSPNSLVEVFSITVCLFGLKDSTKLGLCGTIECSDASETFLIFDESKKKPRFMRCSERVQLKSIDRCYDGRDFGMKLDLKDKQGNQISKGCLVYNSDTDKNWQNRRLCSIVRGKNGFAAVHYSVFVDAVQAKVCLTLMSSKLETLSGCQVYGRISAGYGNFKYSTPYEKEFYRSILFEKDEDEAVEIQRGDIPLSKSVVAVPLNGSVVVAADVNVLMDGEAETLKYAFAATVSPENYGECEVMTYKIQCGKFRLEMHVIWGKAGNKADDKRSRTRG